MKNFLLAAASILIAVAADATCLKCDQSTGYRCFMSINGTKANCDSPSDAGCITWGSCTSNADCTFGCLLERAEVVSRTDDLKLAAVTVVVPLRPESHAART